MGEVIGIGIDMVEVCRIEKAIGRHNGAFERRVFTDSELEYCNSKRRPGMHLAARFGVKEAVMKAFGTGWTGGVSWKDVEVLRGEKGRPEVALTGRLGEIADEMGGIETLISFSHDGGFAIAQALIKKKGPIA
jgi:holo-[acyl-carrier protein] synthase